MGLLTEVEVGVTFGELSMGSFWSPTEPWGTLLNHLNIGVQESRLESTQELLEEETPESEVYELSTASSTSQDR